MENVDQKQNQDNTIQNDEQWFEQCGGRTKKVDVITNLDMIDVLGNVNIEKVIEEH